MTGLGTLSSAECPDYSSSLYAGPRQELTDTGMNEIDALVSLRELWQASREEQQRQETRRSISDREAVATKFLPINQNLILPNTPRIPSTAVMEVLRKGEYVPLHHFTDAALDELDEIAGCVRR